MCFQEFKKLFRRPLVWIVILVFLGLNVYQLTRLNEETQDAGYWRVYSEIEGEMTDETISFVTERYRALSEIVASGQYDTKTPSDAFYSGYAVGDKFIFEAHREEMERIFLYNSTAEAFKTAAKENAAFYRSVGNSYEMKRNEAIAGAFGQRTLTGYYELSGMQCYLSYDFSSLLILLLLLFLLAPSFCAERETGMDALLRSCKKGGRSAVFAKKHAAMAGVFLVCLLFYGTDLLCFLKTGHMYGWNAPVYQMREFAFSPLEMRVWQFAVFSFFLKVFGCLIISQVILLFSAIFRETLFPFICGAGLLIFCVGFYESGTISSAVNPVSLLCNRDIFAAVSYFPFFNIPILQYWPVLLIGFAELAFAYALIHWFYQKDGYNLRLLRKGG
jgi:hypothetical protein